MKSKRLMTKDEVIEKLRKTREELWEKSLHFVLDAQEDSEFLLEKISDNITRHSLSICRTIVEEVRANLSLQDLHTFIRLINLLTTIDEDFVVPFELGSKYESLGLKPADAFIAAYTK